MPNALHLNATRYVPSILQLLPIILLTFIVLIDLLQSWVELLDVAYVI